MERVTSLTMEYNSMLPYPYTLIAFDNQNDLDINETFKDAEAFVKRLDEVKEQMRLTLELEQMQ